MQRLLLSALAAATAATALPAAGQPVVYGHYRYVRDYGPPGRLLIVGRPYWRRPTLWIAPYYAPAYAPPPPVAIAVPPPPPRIGWRPVRYAYATMPPPPTAWRPSVRYAYGPAEPQEWRTLPPERLAQAEIPPPPPGASVHKPVGHKAVTHHKSAKPGPACVK